MPHPAFTLKPPTHPQQLRPHQSLALSLGQITPDHHIDIAKLILKGDKGDPTGRLRTLAAGNQASHADLVAMLGTLQRL